MKAIIIGAGQGKRLLPLTEAVPKALLDIDGKTLLEWQIDHLIACGVDDIVFIAGFNAPAVDAALRALAAERPGCRLRSLYNPFHAITDNLVSVWMARGEMTEDFVLVNSDTLFSVAVLRAVLAGSPAPITVTIDRKPAYDDDDMKVIVDGARLLDIGKRLDRAKVTGESIGLLLFRGHGPQAFAAALDEAMRDQASLKKWYLSVVDRLAKTSHVQTTSIEGLAWCEIDYPRDLDIAAAMVAGWRGADDAGVALSLTGSS